MGLNVSDFGGNSSNDDETTNDDAELEAAIEELRENSNELAELYLTISDWEELQEVLRDVMDVSWPKMVSSPDMEDYKETLRSRHSDSTVLQQLTVLSVCMKGEVGTESRTTNDHYIGLQDGHVPESHADFNSNKEDTHGSYALENRDLPNITWEGLTEDEKDDLRDEGVDLSELGFDSDFEGPKLLCIDGQRLPFGTEDNPVEIAKTIIGKLPEDPSAYTEDGFRESSDPSVFAEDDSENAAAASENPGESHKSNQVNLAANPEKVPEFTVNEAKNIVSDIENPRVLRQLLKHEQSNDNRGSSLSDRIQQRIRAVDGDDEPETEDNEVDNKDKDEELSLEEVQNIFDFSDLEMDGVQHRVDSGKANTLKEAAKQIAN